MLIIPFLAGERAAEGAVGPGSFMVRFLDALYQLTPEELEQEKKDRERIDRMAALSYSGVHVTDEEWRSGVLNKDKVIETRTDTSEFVDPEDL